MSDPISAAADALRVQIDEKLERLKSNPLIAEIIKEQAALNGLEDLLGLARSGLPALFGSESAATTPMQGALVAVDEFVNLPALDAAKKWLRKAGKPARPLTDIIRGVRAGGGIVNQEDKLRVQLVRSNEVKKVSDDVFGLLEWYPARKGRPPVVDGGRPNTKPVTTDEIPFDDDAADEQEVTEHEVTEDENSAEEENGSPVTE